MTEIYMNGEYKPEAEAAISPCDSGFTTGIGVFDSMLVKNGIPVHIQEHYERLIHDSKTVIGLAPFLSFEKFVGICNELLHKNNLQKDYARIRTTVTGGKVNAPLLPAHTPTILMTVAETNCPDKVEPVRCAIVFDFPRITGCKLENCKRLDYTRSYAARRQAEQRGAQEAILINTDGNIACGATSNIFIEEDGVLVTPPLSDGVLDGVTRRMIMKEREVKEESISPERLKNAQQAFLTNSFIGTRKIQEIIE